MALTTVPVELANLDGAVTVNESSADVDFRIESNGYTHMLFVDGGANTVNIGGSTDQGGLLNLEGYDSDMLVLHRTADTGDQSILFKDHGDHNATITGKNGGGLALATNGNTVAMTIDSSQNVGIGVTPETWNSNFTTLQIGTWSALSSTTSGNGETTRLQSNFYNDGSAEKYIGSGYALAYHQRVADGKHKFRVSNASGSADGSISSWVEGMVIDASGHVTMPLQPAFLARSGAAQNNLATDTTVTVVFGTEVFDVGSNFASNTFTAPVTGKYYLTANVETLSPDTAADYIQILIITSNSVLARNIKDHGGLSSDPIYYGMETSVLADMDANDTATVAVYIGGGAAQTDINTTYTRFSGVLVC